MNSNIAFQSDSELPSFDQVVSGRGLKPLTRGRVTTLQVNVGKLCNMACHHCHVEAGPKRTEIMLADVADRVIEILKLNPQVEVVDLTGGAPEMNPNFRKLVGESKKLGRRVIDRCNLTILLDPENADLIEFLATNQVEIVASLPCYSAKNVEMQRGSCAFDKSIEALGRLNAVGYGQLDSKLKLDLVYNPVGAFLPPAQGPLETKYKEELHQLAGITFHNLLTITNMPIKRFAQDLLRNGKVESYQSLLVNHFNPLTVSHLMCRSLISVGWDGKLYDCDFNQMLEIEMGTAKNIWDVTNLDNLAEKAIATGTHCFGCTAGAGSSCSGALK